MERILSRLRGHQTQVQRMLNYFNSCQSQLDENAIPDLLGEVPTAKIPGQTWLFTGPSGVGKKMAAKAIAQALICQNSDQACGSCGSCLRVAAGHHESVLEIAPDGTQIKMEQAHQIIEFLSLQSLQKARFIIIDEAHRMTQQTANALLKSLEEPPEGTVFFLISSSLSLILPTVRSRSKKVLFHPLSIMDLKVLKSGPEWMLRAARGRLDRLTELNDPAEQELRNNSILCLQEFFQNTEFLTESNWRKTFSDRQVSLSILQYWIAMLRDAMVITLGGVNEMLMNPDQLPLINMLASKDLDSLTTLVMRLTQIENEWVLNIDPTLAVEDLWVQNKDLRS